MELTDQFAAPVIVESIDTVIDDEVLIKIRNNDGVLKDAQISIAYLEKILSTSKYLTTPRVNADSFFLFIESSMIKTAFNYDPHFAVSLSGVKPLPRQLEAVYQHILPQVRLRFLLADDPGAGKTIMALEGRTEVTVDDIRRVIVMCPRPRLRKDPLESIDSGSKVAKVFLRVFGLESQIAGAERGASHLHKQYAHRKDKSNKTREP